MAKITITEALADIKVTAARIQKKRQAIKGLLGRDSRLRDPLENEGGSMAFVTRERQSVSDLEERIVAIRSAIQQVNLATTLEVEGVRRTVAAWLNWRREIGQGQRQFLAEVSNTIANMRTQALKMGQSIRDTEGAPSPVGDLILAISEAKLAEEVDRTELILGQLDGKLSLINATTFIEV